MAKFLDNVGLTKLVELIKGSLPGKATSSTLGLVKPDNSTITVDSDGIMAWGLSDRIVAGNSGNKSLVLCGEDKTNASANVSLSIAGGNASGVGSIAHGFTTHSSGQYSVATGYASKASGDKSFAENSGVAKGPRSHAEGLATASSSCQHAEGKFNIEDANGIFQNVVGAGTASTPNTMFARDWNGNEYLSNNLYVGCNDFTTTANGLTTANAGGSKVATENYVNTAIANLPSGSSFSGSYNDLTDKPTLFSGSYTDLTDKPTLFSGSYNDLTNKPTLFSGSYNDLTDKPTLFSGDYNDLSNKPTIPSAYTLPVASTSTLGGVKVDGSTITIDSNGVISGSGGGSSYTAGNGINIDANGVISKSLSASTLFGLWYCIEANNTNIYNSNSWINTFLGGSTNNWALNNTTGREKHIKNLKTFGMTYLPQGFNGDNNGQYLKEIISAVGGDDITTSLPIIQAGNEQNTQYTVGMGLTSFDYSYMSILGYLNTPVLILFNGAENKGSNYRWYFIKNPEKVFQNKYFNSVSGLTSHSIPQAIDEVATNLNTRIPTAPTTDGTYMLKCVVSSGTPTYSWENVNVGGSY